MRVNRIYVIALACMSIGLGFSFPKIAVFGIFSFAVTAFYDLISTIIRKSKNNGNNADNFKF
jgi:hypothetical protein